MNDKRNASIKLQTKNPEVLFSDVDTSTAVVTEKTDLIFTATDTLSGIKSVEVVKLSSSGAPGNVSQLIIYESTRAAVSEPIGPLAEGDYLIKALDAAGNETTATLFVRPKPVRLAGSIGIDTRHGADSALILKRSGAGFTASSDVHPLQEVEVRKDGLAIFTAGVPPPSGPLPQDYAFATPDLSPGSYEVIARDVKGNEAVASLSVGDFEVHVETSASSAAFDFLSGVFKADVVVSASSDFGIGNLTLFRDPDFNLNTEDYVLVSEFPHGNQPASVTETISDLADGLYLIRVKAGNGEDFSSRFTLLTDTFTVSFLRSDAGAQASNIAPVDPGNPAQIELARGPSAFLGSGAFTSAVKYVSSGTVEFLGGLVMNKCSAAAGDPHDFFITSGSCLTAPPFESEAGCTQAGPVIQPFSVGAAGSVATAFSTGNLPEALGAFQTIATRDGRFENSGSESFPFPVERTDLTCTPQTVTIGRVLQMKADLTSQPQEISVRCGAQDPVTFECISGANWPVGYWGAKTTLGMSIFGQAVASDPGDVELGSSLPALTVSSAMKVPLPGGGEAVFNNVTQPGDVTSISGTFLPPPGYVGVSNNSGIEIQSTAQFQNVKVTLRFDPGGLTAKQLSQLQLVHVTNTATGEFEIITTQVGPDFVTGIANSLSPFLIAFPESALEEDFQAPAGPDGRIEFVLSAQHAGLNVVSVDTHTAGLPAFLAAKEAKGYFLVSGLYQASDEVETFLPAASLTMKYSTATLGDFGLDPASPLLVNLDPAALGFDVLDGQSFDVVNASITATLAQTRALYGVFARPQDVTPPLSALSAEGIFSGAGGVLYASTSVAINLNAADSGTLAGLASGPADIFYLVDPSPAQIAAGLTPATTVEYGIFSGGFSLSVGTRTIAFGAADNRGNLEILNLKTVVVDAEHPLSDLLLDGQEVALGGGPFAIHQSTLVGLSAVDSAGFASESGVNRIEYSLDGGPLETYFESFSLSSGTHVLAFRSVDNVGNAENFQQAILDVALFPETTAPITFVSIEGPSYFDGGGHQYLSEESTVNLIAFDPFDATAPPSDVDNVFISFDSVVTDTDTASLSSYSIPFRLSGGTFNVTYFARDKAGNFEIARSSFFFVDNLPPVVSITPNGPSTTGPGGEISIAENVSISLDATDPLAPGFSTPGSGLQTAYYVVDATIESCGFPEAGPVVISTAPTGTCDNPVFSSPFNLSTGSHTIAFFAVDNIGNQSAPQSAAFFVEPTADILAPETELLVQGIGFPYIDSLNNTIQPPTREYLLQAADLGSPASGVDAILFAFDPPQALLDAGLTAATSSQFQVFTSTFSVGDGSHLLVFGSRDKAGNYEVLKTTGILVDGTPPVVDFVVNGSSQTSLEGVVFFTEGTTFALDAADEGSVVSGLSEIEMYIDVGIDACDGVAEDPAAAPGTCENPFYESPVTLPVGTHTVIFSAVDNVGNKEPLRAASIFVEAPLPPPDITETKEARFASTIGDPGSGEGLVSQATDVTVDSAGNIYIADILSAKILKYDKSGSFLMEWSTLQGTAGENPRGPISLNIAVDAADHIMVADFTNARVQHFTNTGELIRQFGPALGGTTETLSAFGVFGVACDANGHIYITDQIQDRVFKTDLDGNLIKVWGVTPSNIGDTFRVELDNNSDVYVAAGTEILKFDPEGNLLRRFQPIISGRRLSSARGISFDAFNNIYILDRNLCSIGGCVSALTPAGLFITKFGQSGSGIDQLGSVGGLEVDKKSGRIYISDLTNRNVKAFAVTIPTTDIRPPKTELTPQGPTVLGEQGILTISPTTPLAFTAIDDASPGIEPVGVDFTEFRIDGSPFVRFTSTFTVAGSGIRTIEFRSVDIAGNVEQIRSQALNIDGTGPASQVYIDGAAASTTTVQAQAFTLEDGAVTTKSRIAFAASDVGGINPAGPSGFLVELDGVSLQTSSATPRFCAPAALDIDNCITVELQSVLSAGPHIITWRAVDRVGNLQGLNFMTFNVLDAPENPLNNPFFRVDGSFAPLLGFGGTTDTAADPFGNVYLGANAQYSADGIFRRSYATTLAPGSGFGLGTAREFIGGSPRSIQLLIPNGSSVQYFFTQGASIGAGLRGSITLTAGNASDAAFDADGNSYVASADTGKITKFDPDRNFLIEWGGLGSGPGQFADGPHRIAVDEENNIVYATDKTPGRILKFNTAGQFLGLVPGPLGQPAGLATDGFGNIYATDSEDDLLRVFSSTGGLIARFGGTGSSPGQFVSPAGVAIHKSTLRLHVVDAGNGRVQSFVPDLPPTAVLDLSAEITPDGNAVLSWTAPSNDGPDDRAAAYELRFATFPITDIASFLSATRLAAPSPQGGGVQEKTTITNLPENAALSFVLRSLDTNNNASPLSNTALLSTPFIARSTTAVDGTEEVVFTAPTEVGMSILSTTSVAGAVVVATATKQGLLLVSNIFDLTPEGALFSPPAILTFRYSTAAVNDLGLLEEELAIYRFDPILGLVKVPGQVLDTANKLIRADLGSIASIFAVLGPAKDRAPPMTTMRILGGTTFTNSQGRLLLSSAAEVVFEAVDFAELASPSGVALTEFRVDAATDAPFAEFTNPFTLAEGAHRIEFKSRDIAGNVEIIRSSSVFVDASPPAVAVSSPAPDQRFIATQNVLIIAFKAPDAFDLAPAVTALLVQREDLGSSRGERPTIIPVVNGQVLEPLDIDDGLWELQVSATDFVLNSTVALSGVFEIIHDNRPPHTTLVVGGPRASGGPDGALFATSLTSMTLLSLDDLVSEGDEAGLGVALQEISVGGALRFRFDNPTPAIGQIFESSFTLTSDPDGLYELSFLARDTLGNIESSKTISIALDNTPPVSDFAFSSATFISSAGIRYIALQSQLSLSAQDPLNGGVASGLDRLEAGADGEPLVPYVSPSAFSEGEHAVIFRASDRLGNRETDRSLEIKADGTPPITTLTPRSPFFNAGGKDFAPPSYTYSLSATDPVVQETASGVKRTLFSIDSAPLAPFTRAFSLGEGIRRISYRSQDNVENWELLRPATVYVDAAPPETALRIIDGVQSPGPDAASFYASPATRLAFLATDPEVGGVASGVGATRFKDNGGAPVEFSAPFQLPEGEHVLAYQSEDNVGNGEVLRSTRAIIDATPPITTADVGAPQFSDASGVLYITPQTPIDFSSVDPPVSSSPSVAGSGVARIEVSIDGSDFMASSGSLLIPEGGHTVSFRSLDRVGNVEAATSMDLRSDASAPISRLDVGQPTISLPDGTLLVGGPTEFDMAANDPVVSDVASGLAETLYRVRSSTAEEPAFTVFAGTFTLSGPDGLKTIEFFSRDNIGNTEILKSSTVLLDATPPIARIFSPSDDADGICRVFNAVFPILGTVSDDKLKEFHLEQAPGKNAASGFILIASGTASVEDDVLTVWDATALSGFRTLRLTAADLVGNAIAVTLNFYIGDPARQLVLGGKKTFNHPEGVAAGPGNRIYAADTNNDRIRVFDEFGASLAAFGGHAGNDDENERHGSGLDLNKPKDLAVDREGNIFVADTRHDRIVKLSSAGVELSSIGDVSIGKNGRQKFSSGKETGQFKQPEGVAIGSDGLIYVADSGNRRIQVFTAQGAFLRGIGLPKTTQTKRRHKSDGDQDDAHGGSSGIPSKIAVDHSGNIYVTDSENKRALKLAPDGEFLLELEPGTSRGFKEPTGIEVSPNGDCVLVADSELNRVFKFDSRGNLTLAFGEKGELHGKQGLPDEIVFEEPMGIALDGSGRLLVVDRNNERIQRFGLPDGEHLIASSRWTYGTVSVRISKEDGGLVRRPDDVSVDIPPDALPEDTEITISDPEEDQEEEKRRRVMMEGRNLGAVSEPVEYGPHGLEFEKPVIITIPYEPELLAKNEDAPELSVHYWNPKTKQWKYLPSSVDSVKKTVSAKTTHFSQYQVLAPKARLVSAPGDFFLREVYAFPNPAVGGAAPTLHIEVGLADSVAIKIHDIAGREVHAASLSGAPGVITDQNGSDYAYEYSWNGHIPSGVYLYVVTAEKAGKSPIRSTGKFSVVR